MVAEDFNAHNTAWGGQITDEWGDELIELLIRHDFNICNGRDDPPTFIHSQGTSWVDITAYRNIEIDK